MHPEKYFKNWILSATDFHEYLDIMFAVKNEISKVTDTIHDTDTKLELDPCWKYQLGQCRERDRHIDKNRYVLTRFLNLCFFCSGH